MGKKVVDMTTYYKGWPHKGHYIKHLNGVLNTKTVVVASMTV